MKYQRNTTTSALPSLRLSRGISHAIHKHTLPLMFCLFAILLGLNIAAALGASSIVIALCFDSMLCGSMFAIATLARKDTLVLWSTESQRAGEIDLACLLEREVIALDIAQEALFLRGKCILVTGAAGSIGSELCRQVLTCEPARLIALDTNETGLFDLFEELRVLVCQQTALDIFIGDITNTARMARLFAEQRPEIIFHAAAYKHVPLLEQYPDLAIHTNALATYQLCQLAQEHAVDCFVLISTDKAVEPVCVMGATKRLAEMIIQVMARSASGTTRFCAVRFGNVLGSRGSVVPTFVRQIENGGPLTVTDPRATRYFMTIPEACKLVILTPAIAESGSFYLLKMGAPVRILDLATRMLRLYGRATANEIPIVYTGLRPGERLHEILIATDEELRATTNHNILCILSKKSFPSLTTLRQLLASLEESIQLGNHSMLRARLFEIVAWQAGRDEEAGTWNEEGPAQVAGKTSIDGRGYEYVAG